MSLCSENKGADQLCGIHAADLCYMFAYAKSRCSHVVALINLQQLFQRCSPANPSTAVFSQKYAFQRSIFVMGIHSVHSKMTRSSAISGHFLYLLFSNYHEEIRVRMKNIKCDHIFFSQIFVFVSVVALRVKIAHL